MNKVKLLIILIIFLTSLNLVFAQEDFLLKITEPKVISHGQEFPIETQLSFSPETYPSIKFYLVNQSNKSIDAIGKITIQRIDIKEEVGKYQQRIKLKPKERQRIVLRMPQIETTGVYNSIVQYYLDNKPVSKLLKFQWEVKTPLKEVVKKEIPLKKKFVSMMFGILLILIGILIILKMKKTSGSKIIMLLVGLILGLFFVNSHNAYALRSCPEVDLSCVNYHYVTSNCNFSNSSADNYCKNKYGTGWKGCCLNGNAYCYKYKPNGTSCGTPNYGPWSSCSGFSNVCDETGTQSRTVTHYRCQSGKCNPVSTIETRSCTRDTDGISCGICKHCSNGSCTNDVAGTPCVTGSGQHGKCDGNGNCIILRLCPEVEEEDLNCVDFHYVTSNCNFSNSSADNYCKKKYGSGWKGCCRCENKNGKVSYKAYCYKYKPNGTSCGASNYGPWSNCSGFSDICDETGTQSRTVVYYLCWNGKCKSVSKTETRSCTRDTDGISCGICKHCSNGSCTNDVAGTSCVTQEGEPGKCDGNGNCVIEDSEKPVITEISHSPEAPTNSDTVSISTSATDNKGLKYLDIYVGAENVGAFLVKRCDCDSKLTCSCSWSYSNPPIGTYIYYSIATDINYNTAVSAQKTLTVSEISINAPSDLTLSPVPCEKIILEWQDNSENEEGFIIEKGTESGGGAGGSIIYQEIARVDANITAYEDTDVECENVYYYRVRAYAGSSYSDYSNEASIDFEQTLFSGDVFGYAWSSNIGWICFNNYSDLSDVNYKVKIDIDSLSPNYGEFSGYAWSSNIGWISFNRSDLSGCPDGACYARVINPEKLGKESVKLEGWAKILTYSGNKGWVKLYDATIDENGDFHGWAWNCDDVGGISFNSKNSGAKAPFGPQFAKAAGVKYKVSLNMPSCVCSGWEDDGCGKGSCPPEKMRQIRTCNPPGCDPEEGEERCVDDNRCIPTKCDSISFNPSTINLGESSVLSWDTSNCSSVNLSCSGSASVFENCDESCSQSGCKQIPNTDGSGTCTLNVYGLGGQDTCEATLDVKPAPSNKPPVADANGPYIVLENDTKQLDGTGSYDPDGSIVSYTWSGQCASYLDDVHKSKPIFTAPEVSSDTNYSCTLTVTDNDGATDSATTVIQVKDTAPVCGNNIIEGDEECEVGPDGLFLTDDDINCPGKCKSNCTCKKWWKWWEVIPGL